MDHTLRNIPTTTDIERAERVREIIEYLHEINETIPIIVEGKKDASALRQLGIEGRIIKLHTGKNLYDFCDDISRNFERVVLLLDWDKTGENLSRIVSGHLKGHWEEFSSFRKVLKVLCQKDINDIEGIPALLRRLEGDEYPRQQW